MEDLLTVAEVARATGKPNRTTLYQLQKLHRRFPRLMVSFERPGGSRRKWYVNARLLERIDRLGEDEAEAMDPANALDAHRGRIEELEGKLEALVAAHARLQKRAREKGLIQ